MVYPRYLVKKSIASKLVCHILSLYGDLFCNMSNYDPPFKVHVYNADIMQEAFFREYTRKIIPSCGMQSSASLLLSNQSPRLSHTTNSNMYGFFPMQNI